MRSGSMFIAVLAACAIGFAACGGTSNTTTPSPSVPVVPRTTITLDQPADNFEYSQPLGHLAAGQAFDLTMNIAQINRAANETFAHEVAFVLSPDGDRDPSGSTTTTRIALSWGTGSQWVVAYGSPSGAFTYTGVIQTIQTGVQRAVRVTRGSDGSMQLLLDGVSLWTVPDQDSAPTLFVEVVGVRATFTY